MKRDHAVIGRETANIRRGLDVLTGPGCRPRIPVTNAPFADATLHEQWPSEEGVVVLNLRGDARREAKPGPSLAGKVLMLEEMGRLAVRLHRQRRRQGWPVAPRIAPLLSERLAAEDPASYHAAPPPAQP